MSGLAAIEVARRGTDYVAVKAERAEVGGHQTAKEELLAQVRAFKTST